MAEGVGTTFEAALLLDIAEAVAVFPPQVKAKHVSLNPKTLPTGKSDKDDNKGDAVPPSGDGDAPDKKGEGVPTGEVGGAAAKKPKEEREEGRKKRQAPPAQDTFMAPSNELRTCADCGRLAGFINWYGLERDPAAPLLPAPRPPERRP